MKKILSSVAVIGALVAGSLVLTSGKQGDQPKQNQHRCSYVSGAPDGVCGDPKGGRLTCNQSGCHNSYTNKYRWNMLTATGPQGGFAKGYYPGAQYTVTATVHSPSISTFGFEVSPQNPTGKIMGKLGVIDAANTQYANAPTDSNYITHTSNGSSFGPGTGSWVFRWTAPKTGSGCVTFYVAFNVCRSDDGGGPGNDSIVLDSIRICENDTSHLGMPAVDASVLPVNVYPTVSTGQFTIDLGDQMPGDGTANLEIYNLLGERVYQGHITDLKSNLSLNVPAGCYILRLNTADAAVSKKIIIYH